MGKQAIGIYASNFNKRMDKTAYILNYPMKPLVETRVMNMLKMNTLSSGNQVIVAIMTHSGFNQEDSILFNKASVDRGLFHSTIYHTEKDEDKKVNGEEEIRTKPNKAITKNVKFGNYDKLTNQGIIPENTLIEDRDIIMGKMITIKGHKNDNNKMIKYDDCSRSYKTHEECYIDKNYINRNGDGYTFCKVKYVLIVFQKLEISFLVAMVKKEQLVILLMKRICHLRRMDCVLTLLLILMLYLRV